MASPSALVSAPPDEPLEQLTVESLIAGVRHTVIPVGELDLKSGPVLEAAITRCCAQGAHEITLDLTKLDFIDSCGLWTITSAKNWCDRQGLGFVLIAGAASVHEVFEATGLSDVLPFRPLHPRSTVGLAAASSHAV